jgi:predicted RNA methylase
LLPLSELGAYHVYHGISPAMLTRIAEVDGRTTAFTVLNLAAGTHYFAVTAVSILGTESSLSDVGSKTIL